MRTEFRAVVEEAQRWEEFAKRLSLQNAELKLAIAGRDELATWLSGKVLACTKMITAKDTEIAFLRGQVNNTADAYTAERIAHNSAKEAFRILKNHYVAVVNKERESSKRVRELQKLANEPAFVRPAKAAARKKIKRSEEFFSEQ